MEIKPVCNRCGSNDKMLYIGPGDYYRTPNGDYHRPSNYQCQNPACHGEVKATPKKEK